MLHVFFYIDGSRYLCISTFTKKMYQFYDHVLLADNNLRILRVNNTYPICYSLVSNQMSSVRKCFIRDIGGLDYVDSTTTKCIELTVAFDDTLYIHVLKF